MCHITTRESEKYPALSTIVRKEAAKAGPANCILPSRTSNLNPVRKG